MDGTRPRARNSRIERKVSRSVICQKIHFYAACPRIDFETTVD